MIQGALVLPGRQLLALDQRRRSRLSTGGWTGLAQGGEQWLTAPVRLDELLRRQDGVLARAQALEHLSGAALRHRVRPGGPWLRLLPGVYLASTGIPTTRQRRRAGLLYAGPSAALAGPTALSEHGIRAAEPDHRVHVLVPHTSRPSTHRLVVVRRTTRPLLPVDHAGLSVCRLPRAVVDAARLLDTERAVRALIAEPVQRRLLSVRDLLDELELGESAGSALARRVMAEVADGVRSAPEAELRSLLARSAVLPAPRWNCQLRHHGRWLAEPDAYFDDVGLVVESDSRQWHLDPESWTATLDRHDRMEATGLHVLHLTPARHRATPEAVLGQVEQAWRAAARHGPPPGVTWQPRAA